MTGIAEAHKSSAGVQVSKIPKLYLDWIQRGLEKPGKNKKGLAGALGVHPSQVTQLLKGKRRLNSAELSRVAEYTGEPVPLSETNHAAVLRNHIPQQGATLGSALSVPLVRVLAVIAPSVWREAGVEVAITDRVPATPDARVARLKQYACKIEAEPGRFAICVPYSDMRGSAVEGDVVHVRRIRRGQHEDTLRTVRISPRGQVRLELEGAAGDGAIIYQPPTQKGAEAVEIRGLVVGYFHPVAF